MHGAEHVLQVFDGRHDSAGQDWVLHAVVNAGNRRLRHRPEGCAMPRPSTHANVRVAEPAPHGTEQLLHFPALHRYATSIVCVTETPLELEVALLVDVRLRVTERVGAGDGLVVTVPVELLVPDLESEQDALRVGVGLGEADSDSDDVGLRVTHCALPGEDTKSLGQSLHTAAPAGLY